MTEELLDERVKTTVVSVSTTAVPLPASALENRVGYLIQNLGAADLFIGGSDVTSANGVKLVSGGTFSDPAFGRVVLYGRTASGTADVRVMETA